MRKLFILAVWVFPATLRAQSFDNTVSLYTSFFNGGVVSEGYFGISKGKGGASRDNIKTFLLGADHTRSVNKWLKWGAGVEFADHTIETNYMSGSGLPVYNIGKIQRMSIPVYLRADVLKFIFMNFGPIIDIQLKNTVTAYSHSGIGITGGTGIKIDNRHFSFYVQPYYQLHGLIYFTSGDAPERLFNLGIRSGLAYRF